jgi:bifunctional non-homologous end joining protein LigD
LYDPNATALEVIIDKCATSAYQSKRRLDGIKIKIVAQQEFIICGYTAGEREYFGSLVLGLYDSGELVYVGNVGTGFDQRLMEQIYRQIEPLTTQESPFGEMPEIGREITWVRPEVVCAVKFASWTEEGRLRAPVFLGLRLDVEPKECVRETAMSTETKPSPAARSPLLTGNREEAAVTIDGRPLKFTHLNKVFYPAEGYNKRDLLNFYDAVASLLLPYLKDRPLSLKRYPDGIAAEFFFQKDTHDRFPPWVRVEPIYSDHKKAPTRWVLADDRSALLYLTNLGCIDQNPWMSRVGSLDCPDFMLIDLDPQGCEFDRIIEAAQLVRKKLDMFGLEEYPKTTGGDGMHIYVPLEPVYSNNNGSVYYTAGSSTPRARQGLLRLSADRRIEDHRSALRGACLSGCARRDTTCLARGRNRTDAVALPYPQCHGSLRADGGSVRAGLEETAAARAGNGKTGKVSSGRRRLTATD